MASNKEKAAEPAVENLAEIKPAESIYTAAELAGNYKAFGTYREIVVVALRLAGKEQATFPEAKRIIENFKNKEVK